MLPSARRLHVAAALRRCCIAALLRAKSLLRFLRSLRLLLLLRLPWARQRETRRVSKRTA